MNILDTDKLTESDSLRRLFEAQEEEILTSRACRAKNTRGREKSEKECFIRTCFQRDTDRIIHSESFRRLKHKTQVFLSPTNDHFRTRMTHTLEVAGISSCIARCLRLNVDLATAIAYGHDIGHTPFGHAGEEVLNEVSDSGFHHAAHSVRVVTKLEKHGEGLNLTREVIDGIEKHSKGRSGAITVQKGAGAPLTLEAEIVRIADLVAYINHDIDDAIRANVITLNDLPKDAVDLLGKRHSKRIHAMVKDIVRESNEKSHVSMSLSVWEATQALRKFLYTQVYPRPEINSEVEKSKKLLRQMAHWFLENPDELRLRLPHKPQDGESLNRIVVDYLAGMTDGYAIRMFKELFVPHFHIDIPLTRQEPYA